jgi:hypothetical protein
MSKAMTEDKGRTKTRSGIANHLARPGRIVPGGAPSRAPIPISMMVKRSLPSKWTAATESMMGTGASVGAKGFVGTGTIVPRSRDAYHSPRSLGWLGRVRLRLDLRLSRGMSSMERALIHVPEHLAVTEDRAYCQYLVRGRLFAEMTA